MIEGPPPGSYWRVSREKFDELDGDGRVWWGSDGDNRPGIKRFLSEVKQGVVPQTIWQWKDVGSTRNSKQELSKIMAVDGEEDLFLTPKPTKLIERIIALGGNENSVVLDSFAGSGTTAHAVIAQNARDDGDRKFILVEAEGYADTLTAERVRRVIKGIPGSKDEVLKIGLRGSFAYCELGESLDLDKFFDGNSAPTYDQVARYVVYTATGNSVAEVPKEARKDWFVAEASGYRIHLIYKPDLTFMGDLGSEIIDGGGKSDLEELTIRKRAAFRGKQIMVPRVLHREGKKGYRRLDYEADVLAQVDFEAFAYREADDFNFADYDLASRHSVQIDIAKSKTFTLGATDSSPEEVAEVVLDRPGLIRRMLDVVPNPWQGARILDDALDRLRKRTDEKTIINSRLTLVEHIKRDLQAQLEAAAEAVFRAKVKNGEIVFKLLAAPEDQLNFHFEELFKIHVSSGDDKAPLLHDIGTPLKRSLYDTAFKKHVNGFEKDVALYLDAKDAVTWWWRIAASRDWGLQGWMKNKVYPDFLVHLDAEKDVARLLVLETKGKHLEGSADTEFKDKFFKLLEEVYAKGVEAGDVDLFAERPDEMRFRILIQEKAWEPDVEKAIA